MSKNKNYYISVHINDQWNRIHRFSFDVDREKRNLYQEYFRLNIKRNNIFFYTRV